MFLREFEAQHVVAEVDVTGNIRMRSPNGSLCLVSSPATRLTSTLGIDCMGRFCGNEGAAVVRERSVPDLDVLHVIHGLPGEGKRFQMEKYDLVNWIQCVLRKSCR